MKELKDCSIEYYNKFNEHFKLEIYLLDDNCDDYAMRLYLIPEDNEPEEIFSTWIDSDCCEVTGNCEIYKENYDDEIQKAYNLFESIINNVYEINEVQ